MPATTAPRSSWWSRRSRFCPTTPTCSSSWTGARIRFADAPEAVLAHADTLLALGVNVPRATTLMNELGRRGRYAGPTVRTVAQAAAALQKEVLA